MADGTAHEVFQSIIYRDYWHEVALFLAGLRRPNEKADLIARAKEADVHVQNLRGYHGRALILQLLREGVMSEPRHVQTEATRFAMGFLEAPALRVHRTPRALVDSLSETAVTCGDDDTRARIVEVVKQFHDSEDHGLVSLLHTVAGRVLPKEKYIELVLAYSGLTPETRGLVRITRPFGVPDVIEELGSNSTYWEGIPTVVLARRLWSSATRHASVPQLAYPLGLHAGLIREFAVSETGNRGGNESVIRINGNGVPAIWKLYRNVQMIRLWQTGAQEKQNGVPEPVAAATDLNWSNGGSEPLSVDVEHCLRNLIDATDNVIVALRRERETSLGERVVGYLEAILEHLAAPGIVGWIASRCAVEMLQSRLLSSHDLGLHQLAEELREGVGELYGAINRHFLRRMHFVERLPLGMPLAIRLVWCITNKYN